MSNETKEPCPKCGVVADDMALHEKWHERLAEAISLAAHNIVPASLLPKI
jgi:hypothetical protein